MREFQLAASLRQEGNVPGALSHLRTSLHLNPDNARAHLLLAYIHLARSSYGQAEAEARKATALLQAHDDTGSLIAEAKNLLGVILIRRGHDDEAIHVLHEAATDVMNTAPFYAWGNLGWAYYKKGDYDHAIAALQRAVQIQPRFCVGHYRMGETYIKKGDLEKAEEALTHAIEADPRCAHYYQQAWRLRGETRARLGRREDAISDFERCLELGPNTDTGHACQHFLENDQ